MVTIYGVYRSRASRNYWLLNEIGMTAGEVPVIQAYRLKDPLAADAPINTRSAAFLAINPAGGIPAMTDGDLVLAESLAINLYLARTYGGALGPMTPAEEAKMTEWALFAATSIEPYTVSVLFANRDFGTGSPGARAVIAEMLGRLEKPMATLQTVLERNGHLVGGRFTVADVNLAECLRYAQGEAEFLGRFPAVKAWLEACQARPAFRAMWERRLAEPE
jgi:glutathione S-transferase